MLTDEKRKQYETARQMAKEELEQLDDEILAVLAETKAKLKELQDAKRAAKQIYDGACSRLGVESVIEMKDYNLQDLGQ
jgi:hypothetical protein